jgi:hypothetical protein
VSTEETPKSIAHYDAAARILRDLNVGRDGRISYEGDGLVTNNLIAALTHATLADVAVKAELAAMQAQPFTLKTEAETLMRYAGGWADR